MVDIGNTLEMNDYLVNGTESAVRFPADASIWLNAGELCEQQTAQAEMIARSAGRSLHLGPH